MAALTSQEYTNLISEWLNIFIRDLATDKRKVLERVDDFPSNHHLIIKEAIEKGPDVLPKDPEICKSLFNFIEFYATGKISPIEVEVNKKRVKGN